MTDFLTDSLFRAARAALFGEPDPWRRRDPPRPFVDPFKQGPARTFMGWPNLTYKDPLP